MARGFAFPTFPRHLAPQERQAIAEKAGRGLEAHLREGLPDAKWETRAADMMMAMGCQNAVALRWATDRIADLEARLAAQEGER